MKLTVTVYVNERDWEQARETDDVEFDEFSCYQFIDDFFIVTKEDGTQQGIQKSQIVKFFTI